MKLNIYDKKSIVKTYEAETYDLMWGTLEDITEALKIDEMKSGNKDEIVKMAVTLVVEAKSTVNNLLKDIFDGITEDELRCTKVAEIASVLVDVVMYTLKELKLGSSGKN